MNKGVIILLVFSLLIIPSVSADTTLGEGLKNAGTTVLDVLKPLFEFVLGVEADSAFYAGRILLLLIVFSVLYALLDSGLVPFFDSGFAKWVVPLAVSVLGIRFLPAEYIDIAALPSGAFAVTLTTLLPIIGFFFITRGFPGFAQRASWVLLAVFFVGLWVSRWSELSGTSAYWVYPIAGGICIVMAFIEGHIQKWFLLSDIKKSNDATKRGQIIQLEKQLDDVISRFGSTSRGGSNYVSIYGGRGKAGYQSDIKEIESRIKQLTNDLS